MEAKKTAGKITKTEIELYIIDKVRELRLANKVGQKKLSLELKLSVSYVGRAEKLYTTTKSQGISTCLTRISFPQQILQRIALRII